jgi:hypothetical protein
LAGEIVSKEIRHENTKPGGYRLLIAMALIATVLAGAPSAAPTLPHLRGIGEVRDWFNAGKGHVRLVLLLSPT